MLADGLIEEAPALRPGGGQLDDPRRHHRAFAFFRVIVPAVAGLLVWIGVLRAGFSEEPAPATAG